jgi:hypothetical protein
MGAKAFQLIKLPEIKARLKKLKGSIVEIGSDRGEKSTQFLNDFAKKHDLDFFTVDIDDEIYKNAVNICGDKAYQMTGELFLSQYFPKNKKIGFAYLDNFDFIYEEIIGSKVVLGQIENYKKYGIEMNNENSKQTHLEQTKLIAENYADDYCVILFDDTYLNKNGDLDGKGHYAVEYLLENGWIVIEDNLSIHTDAWFQFVMLANKD